MVTVIKVSINEIDDSEQTQARVGVNADVVEEYRRAYLGRLENPELPPLPPLDLFEGDPKFFVGDGHHRLRGARAAGLTEVDAIVHPGGLAAALVFAAGANTNHGLQRSRLDKRKAVRILLGLPEWAEKSNRAIGAHAGVDDGFVGDVRRELGLDSTGPRVGRDGVARAKPRPAEAPPTSEEAIARASEPGRNGTAAQPQSATATSPNSATQKPKLPKNGAPVYQFKGFESALDSLMREIDALGTACGCKEGPELKAARADLMALLDRMRAIHRAKFGRSRHV